MLAGRPGEQQRREKTGRTRRRRAEGEIQEGGAGGWGRGRGCLRVSRALVGPEEGSSVIG